METFVGYKINPDQTHYFHWASDCFTIVACRDESRYLDRRHARVPKWWVISLSVWNSRLPLWLMLPRCSFVVMRGGSQTVSIDDGFKTTEELLELQSPKGTTAGLDMPVSASIESFGLSWKKVTALTTDGAPSMTEKEERRGWKSYRQFSEDWGRCSTSDVLALYYWPLAWKCHRYPMFWKLSNLSSSTFLVMLYITDSLLSFSRNLPTLAWNPQAKMFTIDRFVGPVQVLRWTMEQLLVAGKPISTFMK